MAEEFDPLAPDSDLSPPEGVSEVIYEISGGRFVGILPTDWVDIEDIAPDHNWGSSFQVLQTLPEQVTIKVFDETLGSYQESFVSPILISNNFRRVQTT